MKWLIGIIVALIASAVGILSLLAPPNIPIDEAGLHASINKVRTDRNLAPLQYDETLERAAQQRAERLCTSEFTHDNFIPELTASQYPYQEAGENLAQGNWGTDATVKAWIESETHFNNIVKPEYTETGIGVADCGNYEIVVQWFGQEKNRQ